jgi:hypothetical protein
VHHPLDRSAALLADQVFDLVNDLVLRMRMAEGQPGDADDDD